LRILCSTGTVTRHPPRADYRLIADARELPCDGFELSIYPSWIEDVETVSDGIVALGLPIEVAHAEKSVGARLSEGDRGGVDRLRANGYDRTVTLEPSAVDPDGNLDRARLAEIAAALRALDSRHGT
jgi:hypothetical protein